MRYYRLTFNRVSVPDPAKPNHREWEWFDCPCRAENLATAKAHGPDVAAMHGVKFVDAIPVLGVVGAVLIQRSPAFQPIP